MERRRSDGNHILIDAELLCSLEISDNLLSLHRNLIDFTSPLIPLPPRVADIDLPHETLISHGSEGLHQWLPGYVGVVHDSGWLGCASFDDLEDI